MFRKSLLATVLLATLPATLVHAQTYKWKSVRYDKKDQTSLHDINASGTVLGGFSPDLTVRQCFLLKGKKKTLLNDPDGTGGTECWGISANGTIVGDFVDANGITNGYIYTNNTFTTLNPTGSTKTVVYGVNDKGVAVGYYLDVQGNQHGFIYDGKKYKTVDVKGGSTNQVFGTDNAGDYTLSATLNDGNTHSYLVQGKKKTEIVFQDMVSVAAHHLNNSGQLCATVTDASGNFHAGVYDFTNNKTYVLDYPKAGLTVADGINDSQTIVGRYQVDPSDAMSIGYIATGKL